MNEEQLKKELDIAKKALAQAWAALRSYEQMMIDSDIVYGQTHSDKRVVGDWHSCNGSCAFDTHRARLVQQEKINK